MGKGPSNLTVPRLSRRGDVLKGAGLCGCNASKKCGDGKFTPSVRVREDCKQRTS